MTVAPSATCGKRTTYEQPRFSEERLYTRLWLFLTAAKPPPHPQRGLRELLADEEETVRSREQGRCGVGSRQATPTDTQDEPGRPDPQPDSG